MRADLIGSKQAADGTQRLKTAESCTIPENILPRFAGQPVGFILNYVRSRPFAHAMVFSFVVIAVSCSVFSSWAIRYLVDTMDSVTHGSTGPVAVAAMHPVWGAVVFLAAVIAADNLSWRVAGWYAAGTFIEVTGDVRRDLFHYLTGHSPAYFADRMPASLAARISTAGTAVFTLESLMAWNVLPPCLNVLLSLVLMMTVNPLMGTVVIALSSALALVMFRMASAGSSLHAGYASAAANVDGEMQDVVGNISLVRTFGMLGFERHRLASVISGEMSVRKKSLFYLEKLRLVHAVMTAILTAGLLIWVVLLWQNGQASVGDVVMVVTLGFQILHGTRDLAVALVETIQHKARLSETLSSLLVQHDMSEKPGAYAFSSPPAGDVLFRDVTFSYSKGRNVLEHFNLHITAGTKVGLVGRSGSGKSTMLALLQRQRYVSGGSLLIDGHDIRDLTEDALRGCMSVVPQEVSLLRRSVADNIRYGKPDATDEDVYAAAEAAGCTDFIMALPEGFATEVGDRGIRLSGGQRQRLAIARAFLRNAPILILDEATSALDSESEHHIQMALERLMVGRTVIAVAHRLSTLQDFDRIVVMQNGRIVEDGSPADLEQNSGPYREFLERQAINLTSI
ncbi:MAG: ABC transporter ATP-binding protein/permease [Acetobacter sp.]|nr:ABC transporter ATP-binding protein/permease [Acetobacter sp.]MCI1321485.1 ABC transporter ATP-binding protein/permease [Acetobacter sp.]MCI1374783.1 ABC transporter ATP-binding protein/permease [Acetobacter sp.]MCI1414760.1 ABC transporter ATP-binding protein/permease [Acetobacter sp.]MCI1443188.1 ABC transporter ATP-binding protein/permease [Acetobacter sp.]